ncbi:unnamed protein product [Prorocentrum cordatum]|uniref:Uncharacterized protein n=1 Tax=Prorocentrum cordatum TaxID=2364126 RepID=A0ABN9TX65_9DINO|nr:unnamed protein product [Polarella glacialis]
MAMTTHADASEFEAFQASMEQYCDLALDGLCEQAMDEQGASVLLNLGHDCEEEGRDLALDDLCDQALDQAMDEQAASVLLDLERYCEAFGDGSRSPRRSWLDPEIPEADIQPLCDWAPEVDTGLLCDRAQAGVHDSTYDDVCASALKDLEKHHQRQPSGLQSAKGLSFTSVHECLVQRVRKTVAEYMMWVI